MEYVNNSLCHARQRQFHINLLKTKFSKRCNPCPECPNNTKFWLQTDFSLKILIPIYISAQYADKRWIKITRIGESRQLYSLLVFILLGLIHTLISWYGIRPTLLHKLGVIAA